MQFLKHVGIGIGLYALLCALTFLSAFLVSNTAGFIVFGTLGLDFYTAYKEVIHNVIDGLWFILGLLFFYAALRVIGKRDYSKISFIVVSIPYVIGAVWGIYAVEVKVLISTLIGLLALFIIQARFTKNTLTELKFNKPLFQDGELK